MVSRGGCWSHRYIGYTAVRISAATTGKEYTQERTYEWSCFQYYLLRYGYIVHFDAACH